MEERYQVFKGLSLGNLVTKLSSAAGSNAGWRDWISKAALGAAAVAVLHPLSGSALAQSGSSFEPGVSQTSRQPTIKTPVDASWIWSPRLDVGTASGQGEVYFRKKFTLLKPHKAELTLAAGDEFELFINGQLIAAGQSFGEPTQLDPSQFLSSGVNVIAVRVKHLDSDHVGLAMKMRIKEAGESRYRVLRTDSTWRSYTAKAHEWYKNGFNARSWLTSRPVNLDVTAHEATPQVAMFGGAAKRQASSGSLAVESGNHFAPPKPRVKLSPTSSKAADADAQVAASVAAFAKTQQSAANAIKSVEQPVDQPIVNKVATNADALKTKLSDGSKTNFSLGDFAPANVAPPVPIAQSQKAGGLPPIVPTITSKVENTGSFTPQVSAATTNRRSTASVAPVAATKLKGIHPKTDFTVATVLPGSQTGPIVAMEFNEYGQLLLSRANGPLLIADIVDMADPTAPDQSPQKQVRVLCNEVRSCQGILPLNGDVFVTAEGPDGQALYRLSDTDGDGQAEVTDTLLKFTGEPTTGGPQGITLGPDGMLYIVVANYSQLKDTVSRRSPYQVAYEGDLQPGPKNSAAPCGTVIRVGVDGSRPETVAGGIGNAQDLVFNQNGELFIHDSDNENDRGTSWYRPSMVFSVTAGADIGWREGWSKFASYYPDQTPAVCETGQVSPAGAVLYQHLMFPEKYQSSIFLADQSAGKILSLQTKAAGAGHIGKPETFLTTDGLNIRDLAVGQDGALYFCTGDKSSNSQGGVYKVSWNGTVPETVMTFENDLAKVMRHPQPGSAWARQNIAELRRQMGRKWKESVLGVMTEDRNPPKFRIRAMQLSVLYGPQLPTGILQTLAKDESPDVRAQAALMCGLSQRSADHELLTGMLNDASSMVRRKAGEALLRVDLPLEYQQLTHLLQSTDRVEAMTARRLLERIDADRWQTQLVNSENIRLYLSSSLALMTAQPNLERAYHILTEGSKALDGYLSDEDFLDLLRVTQITLAQGQVDPGKIPAFVQRLGEEFPAGSPEINMELVKVLSGLGAGELDGRLATWLQAPTTTAAEKSHAARYFQQSSGTLSSSTRLLLSQAVKGGNGFSNDQKLQVIEHKNTVSSTPAAKPQTPPTDNLQELIAGGDQWPEAVIASFQHMPNPLTNQLASSLRTLDQKMTGRTDHAAQQVRLGIIAMLAEHGSEASFAYLRECFDSEPHRRADLAIGLALQPDGDNWSYLVSSLPVVDDVTGDEILKKLTTVRRRPKDPVHYRDVIELGYRLEGKSAAAVNLLAYWTGNDASRNVDSWQQQLGDWSQWYAGEFPTAAPIATASAGEDRVAEREMILDASNADGTLMR